MRRLRSTDGEIAALITRAGLTRPQAAELIHVTPRSIERYISGDAKPSRLALRTLEEAARVAAAPPREVSFRFIDLFAGIGGLRIGFQGIGGHCVFTSEWDERAQDTYALNFRDNHRLAGDIRPFAEDPSLIPVHDVLLAGFPCQPFSIAGVSKKNALGRPHGFLCDTQGTLFFDTAQVIEHHRPAAFVLENVRNLERHDKGRTFATIMNALEKELGYHVQTRVISSEHWVPQRRERIFIVGFREPTTFDLNALELPAGGPKLGSILERHEDVDSKYTLSEKLWDYLQGYKAKHNAKGNGFGYSLFGPDDVTRTLSARYHKDGSEILVAQPGKRPRRLTPLECARLMGFDRGERRWRIEVSDTQAYRQFGNAVVVPVVEFLADAMKPHLETALGNAPVTGAAPVVVTRPDRARVAVHG
ncbi:DNA (cytosine-5-)-methyltransferase [Sphingomonas sp. Leaf37]|uniref:DNA (cytosine-5-)-methyltransferase n=1 Tax=Sphingomonas sp. Leaf37 TaxID=2876552 RepID=UPI001E5D6C8E|nr:DNA (cytosine-5-)-methyltransferase [Sphingomonas sp. Leaf37]